MPRVRRFLLRLYNLLRPAAAERELTRELAAHATLIEDDCVRQGLSPEDAQRQARLALGGLAQARELHREARSFQWVDDARRDATRAIRSLSKQPVVTTVIVLTLAIGIGATSAMFSLADALWLRPLRAPDASRLVRFEYRTGAGNPSEATGPPDIAKFRRANTAFAAVAAHWKQYANLTEAAYPQQVVVGQVTANFFSMFGATTIAGRTFSAEEDHPGGPSVVVISETLWRRQFLAAPDIISKVVRLGGEARTVVGVLPASFRSQQFEPEPDAWEPMQVDETSPNIGLCIITGQLRPGITLAAANAQLHAMTLAETNRRSNSETFVVPLRDALIGEARTPILLLCGSVLLLLLIAIANVAGVLLVRSLDRSREFTIQAAVGAGRSRIVRQVLAESVLLALAGGAAGTMGGIAGIRLLLEIYRRSNWLGGPEALLPRLNESLSDVVLDWRVALFAAGVTVVVALVFGLLPAIHAASLDVGASLKEGGPRTGEARGRVVARGVLVGAQVALTVILLVAAGLLVRSAGALLAVNRGYHLANVVTMRTAANGTALETPGGLAQLSARGIGAIRAVPGVRLATASCCVPLDVVWQLLFVIEGRPLKGFFHGVAGFTFVSPDYFETLGIPVLRGRGITAADAAAAEPVIVINEAMARRFWPDRDPLGEHLTIGHGMHLALDQDPPRRIVGIVGNVREQQLSVPPRPAMYVPSVQLPAGLLPFLFQQLPLAWIVQTEAQPAVVEDRIRDALENATGVPVTQVRTMEEVGAASIARTRFNMTLMSIFGVAAAFLASIGIYGFMTLLVKHRTRELAIRVALGASTAAVRRLVFGRGLALAACGIVAGIAAAWELSRVLAGVLFGITPHDAAVFVSVPLLLIVAAVAAIWSPSRRATRLEPAIALRSD